MGGNPPIAYSRFSLHLYKFRDSILEQPRREEAGS